MTEDARSTRAAGGRGRYGISVAPGPVRLLGLPVVAWIPSAFVVGVLSGILGWSDSVFDIVQFLVFPVVFALASVILVIHFYARRASGTMRRAERGDHRFVGALTAVFAIFGTGESVLPLIVCVVCLALMMVRTRVPKEALWAFQERK